MVAIAQERSTPVRFGVRNALNRLWSHFLVRRIAKALFTVFFVSTLIFFLVRLLPGSPVEVLIAQLIGQYGYSYEMAANQARSLFAIDPDQPLLLQYLDYLKNLARGDLGQSLLSPGVPVTEIIFTLSPLDPVQRWSRLAAGVRLRRRARDGDGLPAELRARPSPLDRPPRSSIPFPATCSASW